MTTRTAAPELAAGDAVRAALRKLLLDQLEGTVPGDDKAADQGVRLKKVYHRFPTAMEGFTPPCASLTELSVVFDDWNPSVDEDVFDDDLEMTTLTAEVGGEIALDLWGQTPAERQALKAALPALFRLELPEAGVRASEGGASLLLELPDGALPASWRGRVKLVARVALTDPPRDFDDPISAAHDEWRARATVTWDAQTVTVTVAERMDVLTQSGGVVDPGELSSTTSTP